MRKMEGLARSLFSFLFLVLGFGAAAHGATLYVKPGNTCGGANRCFPTIQGAINRAAAGDKIEVAAGTYNEHIVLKNNITLKGAGDGLSVLKATKPGPIVQAVNVRGASISGFKIQGGYTENLTGDVGEIGRGIYCANSALTISENVIADNNSGLESGPGIEAKDSSVVIEGNLFSGNRSLEAEGGGVCVYGAGEFVVKNNRFLNNSALDGGGGLACSGKGKVYNNHFEGNSSDYGGAIYTWGEGEVYIFNNLIVRNSAYQGGGIHLYRSNAILFNNTVGENRANGGSAVFAGGTLGSSTAKVFNSIFWGNIDSDGSPIWNCTVDSSIVQDGTIPGVENIQADPRFVGNGNYRLSPASPAIDAGNTARLPSFVTTDFDGKPRVADGNGDGSTAIDMGAFEVAGPFLKANIDVFPDTIYLKTRMPVAAVVFGSRTVDATRIRPESVRLASAEIHKVGQRYMYQIRDMNGDGFRDFHFTAFSDKMALAPGEFQVELTAELTDGTPVRGTDQLQVIGRRR